MQYEDGKMQVTRSWSKLPRRKFSQSEVQVENKKEKNIPGVCVCVYVCLSVCLFIGQQMPKEASDLQVLQAGSPFKQSERARRGLRESDRVLSGLQQVRDAERPAPAR